MPPFPLRLIVDTVVVLSLEARRGLDKANISLGVGGVAVVVVTAATVVLAGDTNAYGVGRLKC